MRVISHVIAHCFHLNFVATGIFSPRRHTRGLTFTVYWHTQAVAVIVLNVVWSIARERIRPFKFGRTMTLDRVLSALELAAMAAVCNMDAALREGFQISSVMCAMQHASSACALWLCV
jgi:hypothetical protein